MGLREKIHNLTRDELIELICNTGAGFYIKDRDIQTVRAKSLLSRAKAMSDDALAEMHRYARTDHVKWRSANKKFDRAMKLYDQSDKIREKGRNERR